RDRFADDRMANRSFRLGRLVSHYGRLRRDRRLLDASRYAQTTANDARRRRAGRFTLEQFELFVRSSKRSRRKFRPLAEASAAAAYVEHVLHLLSENSFADLTLAPAG